jgi:hypothetical protein
MLKLVKNHKEKPGIEALRELVSGDLEAVTS